MAEELRSNDDLLREIGERQLKQVELEKQIKELTKQLDEKSPEAIYALTVDRAGQPMMTVRSRPGEGGRAFFMRFDAMLKEAQTRGYFVRAEHTAPSDGKAAPPPTQPTQAQGNDENGVAHCVLMMVGESYASKKPQLQFVCDGLEHPLTYTRVVEEMQKLLAPVRKFTAQELAVGKKHVVDCLVVWEMGAPNTQGKRYRNVIEVRPTN